MRNLLLHIAYNGSRYHGYQVQQNAVSVAGTFQPVLEKILAEKVRLKGCSRTGYRRSCQRLCCVVQDQLPYSL